MELSRRISAILPSPTLALNSKANQLKKLGHHILNFAVGEPDYPTPEIIVNQAIASLKAGRTKYTPAGGGAELRTAIADKLLRDNHLKFSPDQIVVGCGAKEILFHIFLALLNEGDEVILTAPCWVSYADQIKAAGATPVIVPLPAAGAISLADIERHATARTKALVLNTPNNPAGYVLTESQTQEIGNYLSAKAWWIISDEIYEYMAFDSPHICLLERFPHLADRYLLVNGLSKGFAMTGWRVGYLAGPVNVVSIVKSLQSHSSTCIPGFIEDAAVVALNAGEPLLTKDVQKLKNRRELAISTMNRLGGFKYIRPQGAYYVFIDVRHHLKDGMTSLQLSESLLENHHLAMAPGEAFACPGWLRLSYAVADETIVAGLERLHAALNGAKGVSKNK
ncbi:MAG: pyridoxal phosphate-dependent aminotransferase [Proteobacteria bacterium]|nr:pyridoxal phosphate-dependent aminotransferase [Pseudomonadota bacterium]